MKRARNAPDDLESIPRSWFVVPAIVHAAAAVAVVLAMAAEDATGAPASRPAVVAGLHAGR